MTTTTEDCLDFLGGFVLEDGRLVAEAATDFQEEDFRAIFNPSGPLWHFLTRPAGGPKVQI